MEEDITYYPGEAYSNLVDLVIDETLTDLKGSHVVHTT